MLIDLNADLGEGVGTDADLMPVVTSANVCCGAHAGTPDDIRDTLELAVRHAIRVGAHPGYADRDHFGRRDVEMSDKQLGTALFYQVGALIGLARAAGATVRYVKPHGALYNRACRDRATAGPVAAVAALHGLAVMGLPNSELKLAAERVRVEFIPEGFADRRYRPDGSLVPRSEADSLIHDVGEAVSQVERLTAAGVRSVCVHGDSPGAAAFAAALRDELEARGWELTHERRG